MRKGLEIIINFIEQIYSQYKHSNYQFKNIKDLNKILKVLDDINSNKFYDSIIYDMNNDCFIQNEELVNIIYTAFYTKTEIVYDLIELKFVLSSNNLSIPINILFDSLELLKWQRQYQLTDELIDKIDNLHAMKYYPIAHYKVY